MEMGQEDMKDVGYKFDFLKQGQQEMKKWDVRQKECGSKMCFMEYAIRKRNCDYGLEECEERGYAALLEVVEDSVGGVMLIEIMT
jgi:hypothetical protein